MKRLLVIASVIALIIPIAIVVQKTETTKTHGNNTDLVAQKDDEIPSHRGSGR